MSFQFVNVNQAQNKKLSRVLLFDYNPYPSKRNRIYGVRIFPLPGTKAEANY